MRPPVEPVMFLQPMGRRFPQCRGVMAHLYRRFPGILRFPRCLRVADQYFSSRLVESVSTKSVACGWVRR